VRLVADENCVTEDKDFEQLVFAAAKQNSGVILIRYPASARSALSAAELKLLSDNGEGLYSRFAVLELGRVRVTQLVTWPDAPSSLTLGIKWHRHSLRANPRCCRLRTLRYPAHHFQNDPETLPRTLSTSTRALGKDLQQNAAAGSAKCRHIRA
jgi:hypothetical protein